MPIIALLRHGVATKPPGDELKIGSCFKILSLLDELIKTQGTFAAIACGHDRDSLVTALTAARYLQIPKPSVVCDRALNKHATKEEMEAFARKALANAGPLLCVSHRRRFVALIEVFSSITGEKPFNRERPGGKIPALKPLLFEAAPAAIVIDTKDMGMREVTAPRPTKSVSTPDKLEGGSE